MVKTPKTGTGRQSGGKARHSKQAKPPVTIDLEAKPVAAKKTGETTSSESSQPPKQVGAGKPDSQAPKAGAADKAETTKPAASKSDATAPSKSASKTTAPPKPAATEKATAKPAPERQGGGGGRFIAAVLGGLIALGGAGLLQYIGVLGTPGAGVDTADFVSSSNFETSQSSTTEKIASLEEQLSAASAKIAELETAPAPAPAATPFDASGLIARIETIESQAQDTTAAQPASGNEEALSALRDRLDAIEKSVSGTSETGGDIAALSEALKADITTLETRLADLATQTQQSLSQQDERLSELNASVAADSGEDTAELAARAIAAAALKADIDRGVPFNTSLNTLKSVAGADVDLSALEPYAETGVALVSTLRNEFFGDVSTAIINATSQPEDNSISGRLLAGARSLVKIEPLTPVEGQSPEALISRIKDALESNELETALSLWEELPEAGKNVSRAWADKLAAREKANSIVNSTVQAFLISSAG